MYFFAKSEYCRNTIKVPQLRINIAQNNSVRASRRCVISHVPKAYQKQSDRRCDVIAKAERDKSRPFDICE